MKTFQRFTGLAMAFSMLILPSTAAVAQTQDIIYENEEWTSGCFLLTPGKLIKVDGIPTVYMIDARGSAMPFANEDIFYTWFDSFKQIQQVSRTCTLSVPVTSPSTANYRPGTMLVKSFGPEVYAIADGFELIRIADEQTARKLKGDNWARYVRQLSDVELANYTMSDKVLTMNSEFYSGMFILNTDTKKLYIVRDNQLIQVQGMIPSRVFTQHVRRMTTNQMSEFVIARESISADELKFDISSQLPVITNPEAEVVFQQMLEKTIFSTSVQYAGNVTYESDSVRFFDDSQKNTFSFNIQGAENSVDKKNTASTLTITFTVPKMDEYPGGTIYFDIKTFEDTTATSNLGKMGTMFFKVRGIQPFAQAYDADLSKLENVWIRFDSKELVDALGLSEQTFDGDFTPVEMPVALSTEQLNRDLLTNIKKNRAITVSQVYADTTINNEPAYHYGFTVHAHGLVKALDLLLAQNQVDLSIISKYKISKSVRKYDGIKGEIWIGKNDLFPRQMNLQQTKRDSYGTYKISLFQTFSGFNQPVEITRPQTSISIKELGDIFDTL